MQGRYRTTYYLTFFSCSNDGQTYRAVVTYKTPSGKMAYNGGQTSGFNGPATATAKTCSGATLKI